MSLNILAIETATEACSAALIKSDKDGADQLFKRFERAPREHTKLILPMIGEVLDEAGILLKDVNAIAFGRGPGAFTGLRIAAGVAQGLALSADIPVVPVSTLAAVALQASIQYDNDQIILPALDARMNEVYWGVFSEQVLQGDERVSPAKAILDTIRDNYSGESIIGIGSGWDVYQSELATDLDAGNVTCITGVLPSAQYIAQLALVLFRQGKFVDAEKAQPVYIRDKVAEKTKK